MACTEDYYLIDNVIITTNKFDITVLEKGISIYEVVKIINKVPLFLENHLDRLKQSAKIKNLTIWETDSQIRDQIMKLIEINAAKEGRMKFALRFHESGNKLLCFFLENIEPKSDVYIKGIKIIPKVHSRINPNAKVINYSLRKAVKKLIKKENAFETLLIDELGKVKECSKSNIFFIKNNVIYTAYTKDVLPGVTRKYIFDICKKVNIEITEKDIYYKDLSSYEAAFISGTSIGVLGVKTINSYNFSMNHKTLDRISKIYKSIADKYISDFDKYS